MKAAPLITVVALLCATELLLLRRGDTDKVPSSQPLSALPETIGSWSGTDVALKSYVLDVLGKGVFLNRDYMPPEGQVTIPQPSTLDAPIGLFIGYFPTQRTGQAIHSPQNCLPGSGWTFDSSSVTKLKDVAGREQNVGEYVISNGKSKAEVLYWYRSHGRTMANDYVAKWYTLLDSIRYQRTDAALVRVITPVLSGETQQQAHNRVVAFADRLNPLLSNYIPD